MGLLFHHPDDTSLSPMFLAVALPLIVVTLGLGFVAWTAVYNVFFHPLRKYPGPKLWAMSHLPYSRWLLSGNGHRKMLEIHMSYGPVVRVAPDIICYNHPDAMKEIRGHRKGGKPEHQKDPYRYGQNKDNIIGAYRAEHSRYRRSLANGFSHQAMLDQQPIIMKYVDRLFQRVKEESAGGTAKVDMGRWYNYATFDIIGDLSFGESFGCLEDSAYHPWVALVFDSIKNVSFITTLKRFSILSPFLERVLIPRDLATKYMQHKQLSTAKVQARLAAGSDRPDFIASMTTTRGEGVALTLDELASNASVLITAGSETTATALSAATYYLALNPEPLAKLTAEVRSAFSTEDEINLLSVQHLPYLLAVLDEAMRLYPPTPTTQPRIVAEGGDTILGQYVPAGTAVEIWQWVMYHNPAHFKQPEDFIPERWLGDQRFDGDKKEAFQPFSVGPRNCIGKNLAYSEMRLMLARLMWNFDIGLAEGTHGWDRNKVYIVCEKSPMNVYLKPRQAKESVVAY